MPNTYLDFVSFVPWTIIFTWCNLFVLFFLVRKFLFKPVDKMLQQRQDEIDTMYRAADTAQTKAGKMEKELSEKLADAEDRAGEIIQNATVTAKKREEEIVDRARVKADRIVQKAEADIEQEKKKAYQEVKGKIAEISVSIAEKAVKREINAGDHQTLISEFIENIGESK